MQDIADAAGVHVMTVSNALGNKRIVAPETREKVRRIAAELNYIPNFVARSLVAGRTGMIAVVSGALNESYYANMVHWLESIMFADGYRMTLLHRPHDVIDLVNATGSVPVDGAIAIDMFHLVDEFRSHPAVPCVSIGTYERSFLDYVQVDLSVAVEQALEIMWSQNRRRIAYIVDAEHLSYSSEVRARTYTEFMQRKGLAAEIINTNTNDSSSFKKQLKMQFERNGCPNALLCLNDDIAMLTFRVVKDLGHNIPQDVLLVGCDGQLHTENFDPPLSTIFQPSEKACELAWHFLIERMQNPTMPLQHAILQGELLVRGSLQAS